MPEEITAESLVSNIMETISEGVSKHKKVSFFEEKPNSDFNRLFGREKPVHHLLGGGKSADMLLWRDKKISAGSLAGATLIWVLFEWLNYHFLSLLCFLLSIALLLQFVWTNASGLLKSSPSSVPRLTLPDEAFVNIGRLIGSEVNRGLSYLQETACEGSMKHFLLVVASLWAAAIIGSWCNFLTLLYIGFVAAHTLPIFYEKYEKEVDGFILKVGEQLQHNYGKLDSSGLLSRIPMATFFKAKKVD